MKRKERFIKNHRKGSNKVGRVLTGTGISFFLVFISILSMLLLSSCQKGGSGIDPLEMRFTQLSSTYYLERDVKTTIPLQVYIKNRGGSHAIGTLYPYGYSPTILHFNGVKMEGFDGKELRLDFSINDNGFSIYGNGYLESENFMSNGQFVLSKFPYFQGGLVSGSGSGDVAISKGDFYLPLSLDFLRGDQWNIKLTIPYLFTGSFGSMPSQISSDLFSIMTHGGLILPLLGVVVPFNSFNGKVFVLTTQTLETVYGSDVVAWEGEVLGLPPGQREAEQRIGVRACYLYSTDVYDNICIDPYYEEDSSGKACRFKKVIHPKNSDGPVKIDRIDADISQRNLYLTLHIKKVGRGELWAPQSIYKCSPYYTYRVYPRDKNTVLLPIATIGSTMIPMKCTPGPFVTLDERGEAIVTCKYPLPNPNIRTGYTDQLYIQLVYGYQQDIFKNIKIKKI